MPMGRLRVGLVCGHFDPARDGVADYTRHLARQLRASGIDAVICTARSYAHSVDRGVVGVTDRWNLPGVLLAARNISRLRLDLVHVQFAPSAYGFSRAVGLLPGLLAGIPMVATLHEYGVWSAPGRGGRLRDAAWSALERQGRADRETLLLTLEAKQVLVTSPEHAEVVRTRFPDRDVTYVPIAPNIPVARFDHEDIPAVVRKELGLPPDAIVALFFGFLHPVKGLERLIEAVATVRRELPGLRLVLAGGGESHSVLGGAATALRRELEDAARRHGVEHEVVFTGYLSEQDVSRMLQAADAAVFSFNAGVTAKSGSLLAALAHGVPTIATAPPATVTGPAEVDGVLRIPPLDTAALAQALRLVLSDGPLAGRLAAAGRASAAGRTWPAIAAIHAETYAEVLGGADRRARSSRGHG